MPRDRVVIVGAGIAGLVSAFALAARGLDVTRARTRRRARRQDAADRASARHRSTAARPCSPCAGCSTSCSPLRARILPIMSACVRSTSWRAMPGTRTPGSTCSPTKSARSKRSAISQAPRRRRAIATFCRDTRRIYDILEKPFLRAPQPSMSGLIGANGFRGLMRLPQIKPFSSMWSALSQYFHDPRLRQLFGRYATYCGSSPFKAPATLMLVAHVEREGVWSIDGGMHGLARALAGSARGAGRDDPIRRGSRRGSHIGRSRLRRQACER